LRLPLVIAVFAVPALSLYAQGVALVATNSFRASATDLQARQLEVRSACVRAELPGLLGDVDALQSAVDLVDAKAAAAASSAALAEQNVLLAGNAVLAARLQADLSPFSVNGFSTAALVAVPALNESLAGLATVATEADLALPPLASVSGLHGAINTGLNALLLSPPSAPFVPACRTAIDALLAASLPTEVARADAHTKALAEAAEHQLLKDDTLKLPPVAESLAAIDQIPVGWDPLAQEQIVGTTFLGVPAAGSGGGPPLP
jgi:hypothetical protein